MNAHARDDGPPALEGPAQQHTEKNSLCELHDVCRGVAPKPCDLYGTEIADGGQESPTLRDQVSRLHSQKLSRKRRSGREKVGRICSGDRKTGENENRAKKKNGKKEKKSVRND